LVAGVKDFWRKKRLTVIGKLHGKLKLRVDGSDKAKDGDKGSLEAKFLVRVVLSHQVAHAQCQNARAAHDKPVEIIENNSVSEVCGDQKVRHKDELHGKHAEKTGSDLGKKSGRHFYDLVCFVGNRII